MQGEFHWRAVLALLFIYRCVMTVMAQNVITSFTSLGDFGTFGAHLELAVGSNWFFVPEALVANAAVVLSRVFFGSTTMVSLAFQAFAFYGLSHLITSLEPHYRTRLVPLLFLPSFTLWSSITGKEAVLVFALSVVCAYLIDVHHGRERLRPIHLFAAFLLVVFKPHYGAALAYFYGVSIMARHVHPRGFVAFMLGALSLVPLYLFFQTLSELSFQVLPHFEGGSTRAAFWVNADDVYVKAAYGMLLSFIGPTLTEALRASNPLHVVTFCESVVLITYLTYQFLGQVRWMSIYNFFLASFSLFWILFANYPFGVMNPGGAVRYRTGYMVFIFVLFAVIAAKQSSPAWWRRAPIHQSPPSTAPADALPA